jgi:UDP-glucose 4-epimerase
MSRLAVLVTGAGGFIGSVFVARLVRLGYDVAAVDRDPRRLAEFAGYLGTGRLRTFHVDITDQEAIVGAMMATQPAAVVHLAASHFIPECETRPRRAVDINVGGLINVLEAADQSHARSVVFASSADVYAASLEQLAESDPTLPPTVYGMTKLLGERLVSEWVGRRSGRRATTLRIFNVYGPTDNTPHVIPDILAGLRDGGEIRVGNLEARRDFIYVDDVVDILCRVLESTAPPTLLNVGTGLATSVSGVLEILQEVVDRPLTWVSDSTKIRENDRLWLRADTSRLRSAFPGFEPRDLQAGLADLLASGEVIGESRQRRFREG